MPVLGLVLGVSGVFVRYWGLVCLLYQWAPALVCGLCCVGVASRAVGASGALAVVFLEPNGSVSGLTGAASC